LQSKQQLNGAPMSKFKVFTTLVLLATTPSMLVYPQYAPTNFQVERVNAEEQRTEKDYILSYDDMLRLLDENAGVDTIFRRGW
jgi:hypothetical protein